MRELSLRRRVMFALATTVMAVLLLEGALRLLGLLWLAANQPDEAIQSAETQVWAFGDSFTFGLGADDPARDSYPMKLVSALEAAGVEIDLQNFARPGHSSGRQLQLLREALLAGEAPDLITLMVGLNDTQWLSAGGPVCWPGALESAGAQTFAIPAAVRQLRIVRLGSNIAAYARDAGPADRGRNVACEHLRSGFLALERAEPEVARREFGVVIGSPFPSPWAELGLALTEYRWGDPSLAAKHFAKVRAVGCELDSVALLHAVSAAAAGDPTTASSELELLGARGAFPGLLAVARAWAALHAGRLVESRVQFEQILASATTPKHRRLAAEGLGWTLLRLGRRQEAAAAFDAAGLAHEHADAVHGTRHDGRGWFRLGRALASEGPDRVMWLSAAELAPRFKPQEPARALERGAAAAPVVPRFELGSSFVVDSSATLAPNIGGFATLAKASGARLVVVNYPAPPPGWLPRALERAADQSGAPWVDPGGAFDDRTQTRRPEEIFIPDGHLTTEGYAILAEILAEALLEQGLVGTTASPRTTLEQ
jgi:lysophospholipase L1-like esterase